MMKRVHLWCLGVVLGACADADPEQAPIEPPPEAPASIDEAVTRRLGDAGLQAVLADDTELCRRLFADLIGRLPSADEVAQTCAGQDPVLVAAQLQAREEYVVQGLRRWRDRLGSSDALLYWQDLMPAFDWVEQLQRGEIDYATFAVALSAEPGLMALDLYAVGRASRVHRVFMGAEATDASVDDLLRLTRIWDVRRTKISAFGAVLQQAQRAYVVPGHCGPLGECTTELIEGGRIIFPDPGSRPFSGIRYDLLSDEQRAALSGLGTYLVTLPGFWEAAADEVLDRLLDYSDGGAQPRRAGLLMPEVRMLVADHLRDTGSIASAERLVIGSLLYRQSNRAQSGDESGEPRPVWASGPLKPISAEVLMDTVRGQSTGPGSCDPRFADDEIYEQHIEGLFGSYVEEGGAWLAEYEAFITEFHAEQGNWRPLIEQTLEFGSRSVTTLALASEYRDTARLFGGCPGSESPRTGPLDGLGYALGQENAAQDLCASEAMLQLAPADATLSQRVTAYSERLLSRPPSDDELDAFEAHACTSCNSAELAYGTCVALLGSQSMLFH